MAEVALENLDILTIDVHDPPTVLVSSQVELPKASVVKIELSIADEYSDLPGYLVVTTSTANFSSTWLVVTEEEESEPNIMVLAAQGKILSLSEEDYNCIERAQEAVIKSLYAKMLIG